MFIGNIINKICDYTKPRPTTIGDLPSSKPSSGAISGGISGFFAGGPEIALGGAIGGYTGIKTGEAVFQKTNSPELSFASAIGSSAFTGALTSTSAYAGIAFFTKYLATGALSVSPLLAGAAGIIGGLAGFKIGKAIMQKPKPPNTWNMGNFEIGKKPKYSKPSIILALAPYIAGGTIASASLCAGIELISKNLPSAMSAVNPLFAGAAALLGGLAGISGTLMGSQLGDIKDGGITGYSTAYLVSSMLGVRFPVGLVGSISGGIPGVMETTGKKIATGLITGITTGAISGILGGPNMMAVNAAIGGAVGIIAPFAGPKMMQTMRNLTEDLSNFVSKISKPFVKKLGKTGNIALGTVASAIGMLPLSLLGFIFAGPYGLAIPPIIGGAMGAKMITDMYKKRDTEKFVTNMTENQKPFPINGANIVCS